MVSPAVENIEIYESAKPFISKLFVITLSKYVTLSGVWLLITPIPFVVLMCITTFSTPESLFKSTLLLLFEPYADKLTGCVVCVKSIFA